MGSVQPLDSSRTCKRFRIGAQRPEGGIPDGSIDHGGPPVGTIMLGDYKEVECFEDMHCELCNISQDIGEKNDLAAKMPGKVAALRQQLK
jgi:hypothetical protein